MLHNRGRWPGTLGAMLNIGISVLTLCAVTLTQESDVSLSAFFEWHGVERGIVHRVRTASRKDVIAQLDAAGKTRVELLAVFIASERLGLDSRARGALTQLGGSGTEPWAAHLVDSLIKRKRWTLCEFALQQLPKVKPTRAQDWARHREPSIGLEALDAEIAKRDTGDQGVWFTARLDMWKRAKRVASFARQLELHAKANPTDIDSAFRWVHAARSVPREDLDLSWLHGHFRPKSASETAMLADALRRFAPKEARRLWQRALEIPFNDADYRRLGYALHSGLTPQKYFRDGLRRKIAKIGVPPAKRAVAKPPANEERVRANFATAMQSYRQAPTADNLLSVRMCLHFCVKAIAAGPAGQAGVREFLLKSLGEVAATTPVAAAIVERLRGVRDDQQWMLAEDERVWDYLAARRIWNRSDEQLLSRLVRIRDAKLRAATWQRAEKLAKEAHPTRSGVLSWVMTRSRENERAIPLLEDAVRRVADAAGRMTYSFTLFEACLATKRWRRADELWPRVTQRLTTRELGDWSGRLACIAAAAEAYDDAFRIWQRGVRTDQTDSRHLEELAKLGMRGRLVSHFRKLARDEPGSAEAARRVIALIE